MKYSIIIVALVFNLLVACNQTKNAAADEQKNIPEVECANPQIKTLNEYIVLNGVTSFLQKEVVRSTVTGYITEVFPTMGEHIVQNQKLFAIKTATVTKAHVASGSVSNFSRGPCVSSWCH